MTDPQDRARDPRKPLGAKGEKLAVRALKKQGFIILDTNWSCGIGELDIVARKGDLIAFVEVKTRASGLYGPPQLAVTPAKQMKIVKLANAYMKHKRLTGLRGRFDVVAVSPDERGRLTAVHMPAAFVDGE